MGRLFDYSYIDLEGVKYGPFEGRKMAEWDLNGHLDDDLMIFRISNSGKVEEFLLKKLRSMSKTPFLEVDSSTSFHTVNDEQREMISSQSQRGSDESSEHSPKHVKQLKKSVSLGEDESFQTDFQDVANPPEDTASSPDCSFLHELLSTKSCFVSHGESILGSADSSEGNIDKKYHPNTFKSPPFMRLPDPACSIIDPETARAKVFSLYQLIITIPEQLKHYPPFTTETVCCQLCRIDLTGPSMFTHLITIQHLNKVSNCIFTESDVDFWINRVNEIIKEAPASALFIPGFDPEIHINGTESVSRFIKRTRGFVKKPSIQHVRKMTNVISAVLDVASATFYSSSKTNKTKRKLNGKFLSQVVAILVKEVDRANFQRRYGQLLKDHNVCTFCETSFDSFYDACCHVGTREHRDKINNIYYHEGLVATWVRILARNQKESKLGNKRDSRSHKSVPLIRKTSSLDVIDLE